MVMSPPLPAGNSSLEHPQRTKLATGDRQSHIDPNQLCPIPDIDLTV
jgi:hypothetical protein